VRLQYTCVRTETYYFILIYVNRKKGNRKWASKSKHCDHESDALPLHYLRVPKLMIFHKFLKVACSLFLPSNDIEFYEVYLKEKKKVQPGKRPSVFSLNTITAVFCRFAACRLNKMTHDRFSPYNLSQRHSSMHSYNMVGHVQLSNTATCGQVWKREKCSNPVQTLEAEAGKAYELDGIDEKTLIKEELRLSIQSRRIARGLPCHVEIEYRKPLTEVHSVNFVISFTPKMKVVNWDLASAFVRDSGARMFFEQGVQKISSRRRQGGLGIVDFGRFTTKMIHF